MVPLVPVIVKLYDPGGPLHEMVEVADVPSVTLDGLKEHERPEGVELADRLTVPANPSLEVIVKFEDPVVPALKTMGLPEIVKSSTMNTMVAEWIAVPLVPVTVTL